MICAVTTVAQHPMGLDLHLNNLNWALAGCEYEIHVQTFSQYDLSAPGTTFLEVEQSNPFDYYHFWQNAGPDLLRLSQRAEAFLFTEQDLFFTEPVDHLLEACLGKDQIVVCLESPYLGIYLEDRSRLYPRIWEGGTLIPAQLVRRALLDGVDMGKFLRAFLAGQPLYERYRGKLEGVWSTDEPINKYGFLPLLPVLQMKEEEPIMIDTMFEFSLYCYCNDIPCFLNSRLEEGYAMGPSIVHLRGIEAAHRLTPHLYDSVDAVQDLPSWVWEGRINAIVLMLYLSGVYEESAALVRHLRHEAALPVFREKIRRLAQTAEQWMNREQYRRFTWASEVVGSQESPRRMIYQSSDS